MKQFGLLRHAKSDWSDGSLDDFDRPLNKRGREAAEAMGPIIRGCGFDRVLASSAKRVRETVELAGLTNVEFREDMYGASPDRLLSIAASAGGESQRLLMVGHNPTVHRLADRLARDEDSQARHHLKHKFPTCALAVIGAEISEWDELKRVTGVLERFVRPNDL